MMAVTEEVEVWLHREPVDFRRQINGLVLIVEQEIEADPFAKQVYAFTNRRRDRARLLYWDRNGFALFLNQLNRLDPGSTPMEIPIGEGRPDLKRGFRPRGHRRWHTTAGSRTTSKRFP